MDLSGCEITDVGAKVLTILQLEVLYLDECDDITDDSMAYLARSCIRLTKLSLRFCSKITDTTVWYFFGSLDEKIILLTLDITETSVSAEVCALVDHRLLAIRCDA